MSTRALTRVLLLAASLVLLLAGALWARYGSEIFLLGLGPLFCA